MPPQYLNEEKEVNVSTKFMGHTVHPMLIVFPLGLLAAAAIFDVVYVITENSTFSTVAYWMIISGLIGGAAAALFGWMDWTSIPAGTRAKTIGVIHGLTNSIVMLLFLISVLLRGGPQAEPGFGAIALSWIGVLTATVGGWLR